MVMFQGAFHRLMDVFGLNSKGAQSRLSMSAPCAQKNEALEHLQYQFAGLSHKEKNFFILFMTQSDSQAVIDAREGFVRGLESLSRRTHSNQHHIEHYQKFFMGKELQPLDLSTLAKETLSEEMRHAIRTRIEFSQSLYNLDEALLGCWMTEIFEEEGINAHYQDLQDSVQSDRVNLGSDISHDCKMLIDENPYYVAPHQPASVLTNDSVAPHRQRPIQDVVYYNENNR